MTNSGKRTFYQFFYIALFAFILTIIWEFFLDGLVHHLFNIHYHEDTIEKWQHVLTLTVFVILGLTISYILAMKKSSGQEQAEQQLNLMSEIVSNMTEGVSLARASDDTFVYTNRKYEQMFGYERGELLGKHVSILNLGFEDSLDRKVSKITACLNETGEWEGELENIKNDGTHFWVYAHISTFVHKEYGEVSLSVESDITARKRAEEELRSFSQKLVETQEAERKRIALELHDSLGQNLTVINNEIQRSIKVCKAGTECEHNLGMVSRMVVQSLDEVRSISYDLRPPHLDQFGLKKTIATLIERNSQSSGITLKKKLDFVDGDVPDISQITIYRIIQEGLNNIVKHSSASEASVELVVLNSKVHLKISDDGRGFELNHDESKGQGIQGMSERVKILKGSFDISSEKGNGVEIKVVLPIS